MKKLSLYLRVAALSAAVVWVSMGPLLATPSGLNNIPTADVAPEGVIVFQQINNFGDDQVGFHSFGFKYGPAKDWEIGVDGLVTRSDEDAGGMGAGGGGMPTYPFVFQVKRRFETKTPGLTLGLGIAGLSANSDKAGDPVEYAVLSKKFENVNAHAGYMVIKEAEDNVFAGLDYSPSSRLTLRADANNLNDTDNLLSSAGFIYTIDKDWLVEAWYSHSGTDGVNGTFTLKLDYVIRLR